MTHLNPADHSLAQIVFDVRSAGKTQQRRSQAFGFAVRNFLDFFYAAQKSLKRQLLAKEPETLRDDLHDEGIADAYLAALANHLSNQANISPPAWANVHHRILEKPWFALNHPVARIWLLTQSPAAFRERNLFISEDALSRA